MLEFMKKNLFFVSARCGKRLHGWGKTITN